MYQRKNEQSRIDFSGLGGTDDLHQETQEEFKHSSLLDELLLYHKRFGHIHFSRLYEMARQGIIPRRLLHAEKAVCAACLYAKATRRGWRSKGRKDWTCDNRVTSPGQCVSVDQLISPTPGLVAQLKSKLTKSRYTAATIYVDQYTGYGYVHLQKGTTAEETLGGERNSRRLVRKMESESVTTMLIMECSEQMNGEGNAQGKGKDLHSRASTLIIRMDWPKDESRPFRSWLLRC